MKRSSTSPHQNYHHNYHWQWDMSLHLRVVIVMSIDPRIWNWIIYSYTKLKVVNLWLYDQLTSFNTNILLLNCTSPCAGKHDEAVWCLSSIVLASFKRSLWEHLLRSLIWCVENFIGIGEWNIAFLVKKLQGIWFYFCSSRSIYIQ